MKIVIEVDPSVSDDNVKAWARQIADDPYCYSAVVVDPNSFKFNVNNFLKTLGVAIDLNTGSEKTRNQATNLAVKAVPLMAEMLEFEDADPFAILMLFAAFIANEGYILSAMMLNQAGEIIKRECMIRKVLFGAGKVE